MPTSEFLASLELPQAISTVFPRFPELFPTVSSPVHPRCIRAPSPKDPRSYFHSFLPVHAACSLQQSPPQTVSTVSFPSRCMLAACSPQPFSKQLPILAISNGFQSIRILVPSQWSSCPSTLHARSRQAISTISRPSTLHARCLPAKPLRSYFQRFPIRRCILAPSGALPSYSASTLHARFLPAQPPQAISNGFLSVRDASPLPMPQLAPSYLPRFPVLPHCTRGPSQRGPPKLLPIRPSTPS